MSYSNQNPYAAPPLAEPHAPAPPQRTDYAPKGRYQSVTGWGMFAMIMLGASMVVDLVVAGNEVHELGLIDRLMRQRQITQADITISQVMAGLVIVASLGVLILSAIAFLTWFYQAHRNLPALRPSGKLEFSPGWAVGGFFVPIMNLFRPLQVMQEVWSKSDPKLFGTHKRSSSPLANLWWGGWIAAGVLGNISLQMAMHGRTPGAGQLQTLQMAAWVEILRALVHMPTAVVLMLLIWKICQNQDARYRLVQQQARQEAQQPAPMAYPVESAYPVASPAQPLPVAMPAIPRPLPQGPRIPPVRRQPPRDANPFG